MFAVTVLVSANSRLSAAFFCCVISFHSIMSDIRSSFNQSLCEPNWRRVDEVRSYLKDGRYGFVAFLDRAGYKAADNRDCNRDYEFEEDWMNAFSEGYLLCPPYSDRPMTEQEFEDETDPDYGKCEVFLGPYFIDQLSCGWFQFHGPTGIAPGPERPLRFRREPVTGGYLLYP